MLRGYAATHCGYDVPPSQIDWPAMIYVPETDRQAREEYEPHFWYIAKKGLRLLREYMFPPLFPDKNPSGRTGPAVI